MEGDARYRCPLCKKFKKLGWISDYTSRRVAVNGMCQHLKWHMTKHKKRLAKHHAPHQHDSAEPSLIDKALRLRANIMIPMQLDMPYMCAWCQGHLTPLGWQQHGPVRECAIEVLYRHLKRGCCDPHTEVTHSTAPDQESEGTPPKLQWADIRTQCLSPLLIDILRVIDCNVNSAANCAITPRNTNTNTNTNTIAVSVSVEESEELADNSPETITAPIPGTDLPTPTTINATVKSEMPRPPHIRQL